MRTAEDLETAMRDVLAALKAAPDNPVSLLLVGSSLIEQGFTQDQIINRLYHMEAKQQIELLQGNRLRMIKPLS
jgi:hypothetical protein